MSQDLYDSARKLAASPLFDGIATPDLEKLVARATITDVASGAALIEEGGFVLGLHFILEGEVKILKQNKHVATLSKGSFLGELALFGQSIAATATACADKGCTDLVIRKAALEEWFQEDPANEGKFFRNLATELCNRLISTTEQLTIALTAKT